MLLKIYIAEFKIHFQKYKKKKMGQDVLVENIPYDFMP